LESIAQGTRNDDGTLVIINSRDVTEGRALADQLRQAQKMESIGRLAGGVAHDFNNLLGVIIGYGEMINARLSKDDALRQPARQVLSAAQRAASLTQQLLAFSRKQVLRPKVLDLNRVMAETERLLQRVIGEDIRLETVLAPGLPAVRADPVQIQQVVMNLAVNARDAMPRGGEICIETATADVKGQEVMLGGTAQPGVYATITVSDTGQGLDPEVRAHLFEPFFTTKELGKGTGLGLATVYGIVKQSGGNISVDSEQGRGTRFRVFLPAIEGAPEDPATPVRASRIPRGEERLLLAEDDSALRELLRESLEEVGYTVFAASDAQDALDLAERENCEFDLLVTDVVMPGIGGRELSERLAKKRPTLKVLYMSGHTDDALVKHNVQHERMPFLQKPFTPMDLAMKVRELLDEE
jgi:nitrogen-specific signal transduction histidine kinase/CheY-like chemotaxis protein